ncbi:MAG: DUF423 domain-containing protein [bacterium]|nr:DUF423 domain-containing protein [bacterium]MDI1337372.1 DUF423 domain-containing protein [Lacunisphaera sp.]
MHRSLYWITLAAGILGFTGIALGAFGAHALKDTLADRGTLSTWQTAVLYHLIHAVALLALAGMAGDWANARWIGACWLLGVILFSGSLYWLALGGPKVLGPITPLGGLLFLAGWLLVAWNAFRQAQA